MTTSAARRSPTRVAVDLDPDVVDWWRTYEPGVISLHADSLLWLENVAPRVIDDAATALLNVNRSSSSRDIV